MLNYIEIKVKTSAYVTAISIAFAIIVIGLYFIINKFSFVAGVFFIGSSLIIIYLVYFRGVRSFDLTLYFTNSDYRKLCWVERTNTSEKLATIY